MASRQQVLLLYRQVLRAAKRFPSIKKEEVVNDIKAEFKDHKTLTNPEVIRRQMEVGIRSLEQLEAYSGMERHGSEWAVFLKGSCD